MSLRNLAPRTQEAYIRGCKKLAAFLRRSPRHGDFVHCRFADAGRRWVWLRSPTAGIRKPSQQRTNGRRQSRWHKVGLVYTVGRHLNRVHLLLQGPEP
jgi:hypothetical protein